MNGLCAIEEEVIGRFLKFDTVDVEADEYVRGIIERLRQGDRRR